MLKGDRSRFQGFKGSEVQDVYDHAGHNFTVLGDCDRARCHSWFHPPAMRDLRIHGKNRLLGLFTTWLKKQMGVKARAGRSSTCWPTNKANEIKVTLNSEPVNASTDKNNG